LCIRYGSAPSLIGPRADIDTRAAEQPGFGNLRFRCEARGPVDTFMLEPAMLGARCQFQCRHDGKGDRNEVAAAAQDQRLLDPALEVTVMGSRHKAESGFTLSGTDRERLCGRW